MYSASLLREGIDAWPQAVKDRYPGFSSWAGIEALQLGVAQHFGSPSAKEVLLASRSAVLLRLAARLMFRLCRNVLTTDLNWPHWQAIVLDEAARCGQTVTVASVKEAVLVDRMSASDLATELQSVFGDRDCDGVFLPVVNNLGIRLPLARVLPRLKSSGNLRFTLLDAAQSFCHLPEPVPSHLADVTIAGCHKWLRGAMPLGIAACGRPLVAEQMQAILAENNCTPTGLHDPILRFTQEIVRHTINKYSETVNIAPLFSANAAVSTPRVNSASLLAQASCQADNVSRIREAIAETSWMPVETDESLQSGIVLLRSRNASVCAADCDHLRDGLREHGVAVSTYPDGLIRISSPTTAMSDQSLSVLANAFRRVA